MTTLDERAEPGRARPSSLPGGTVWFTGLPSAGKTTLARAVAERLTTRPVELLDGDEVREHLSKGLGFTRADRDVNVTRIGWVAATLARHGILVLASVISPFAETRQAVRDLHAAKGARFLEVYVATPLEVCASRDVKGLYARQRSGDLHGLTGVDAPYEPPASPDLLLPTEQQSLDESVTAVLGLLRTQGLT